MDLSPDRLKRIDELLDAALDLPARQREPFLRDACAQDADLHGHVLRLLAAAEQHDTVLDRPAAEFAANLVASAQLQTQDGPMRIGPYRIVGELGRGGMGAVCLAEREEHFEQRVALKVIRRGLHLDEQMVRRFLEERQMLASLEHANIARLIDGGVTDDGVPWFAMELVEGEPIDVWCDARRLSIEARLELFCTVCDAVAYAHERQIVHRDLKPSNILVRHDGTVKLLDFGIAKFAALDSETFTNTRTGVRMMTPEYASPEQVRGDTVTPASDVYSLGVLLHELLTGRRPNSIPERTSGQRLRGHIEDIVTKALSKDAQQRYPSAGALASDVRRHLEGLPVRVRARSRRRAVIALLVIVVVAGFAFTLTKPFRSAPATLASPLLAVGLISDYRTAEASEVTHPLADLLATNLARVPALRVISAARIHEIMAQGDGAALADAGAYSAAARRAGAAMLVDGALYALSEGGFRLDLRRMDVATGELLAAHTVTGSDIFALVDSGTAKIIAGVGVSSRIGPVADVTTHSEAAYRLYEQGVRAYYRGDHLGAQNLLDAALAEDSTFAMARYYRGRSEPYSAVLALQHFEKAVQLADRATDRERLIIRAAWGAATADPGTLAITDTLAARYPQEPEAHFWAARALLEATDYAGALRRLRQTVELDAAARPGLTPICTVCDARGLVISTLLSMDSFAAAERESRAWTRLEPQSSAAWRRLSETFSYLGKTASAREALRQAFDLDASSRAEPGPLAYFRLLNAQHDTLEGELREHARTAAPARRSEALWYLAILLRRQGRLAEALDVARTQRSLAVGIEPDNAPMQYAYQVGQVLFELGRYRESAALFDSIAQAQAGFTVSMRAKYQAWPLALAANALAAAGDTVALAARIDTIRVLGSQTLLARDRRLHHHVRGLLLLARGEDQEALAEFRRATLNGLVYSRTNLDLARLLLAKRQAAEAVKVLQPALHSIEGAGLYATRTELEELLARAWDAAGARDSALLHYRAVAAAWNRADPSMHKRVEYVRTRVNVLQSASAGRGNP